MHTIWKGSIQFGLVSIPVKLHATTDESELGFKLVHRTCGSTLNYVRTCPACQSQAEAADVVKGFEFEPGKYVTLEKEELERIAPESSKEIQVLHFMNKDEIDLLHYHKSYFLSPDTLGVNGYRLLAAAMAEENKLAVCKFSLRSKRYLAAIGAIDNRLVLTTMYYPNELRAIEAVPNTDAEAQYDPKSMALAQALIHQMTKPYTAAEYRDESRDRLIAYIQHKVAGEAYVVSPEPAKASVHNLAAALQASLDAIAEQAKPAKKPKRKSAAKSAASGPADDGGMSAAL